MKAERRCWLIEIDGAAEDIPDVPDQGSITTTKYVEAREGGGFVEGKEGDLHGICNIISLFAQPFDEKGLALVLKRASPAAAIRKMR